MYLALSTVKIILLLMNIQTYFFCFYFISVGPHPNISITITLTELKSECSRDFLFIYDGDTYFSPLIASISGSTLPSPIVAHSGKVC